MRELEYLDHEYLNQWLNYYECPECDYHFYDIWDSQVLMRCERCNTRDISPKYSWELPDKGINELAVWNDAFIPLVDEDGNSPVDDNTT